LDILPADQRAAILLVSVEDLSYADAAAILGVPTGTLMSRLSRGRDRLSELIGAGERPKLRRVK
jgi:RNA polymerase sigma-70 factor (ECF subfamily)